MCFTTACCRCHANKHPSVISTCWCFAVFVPDVSVGVITSNLPTVKVTEGHTTQQGHTIHS